jgi:iron complex transport system substrate-binding protein
MADVRRIVSLISSATEMLYLLGLGDRVVGVSHECDYPPDVACKPRLTRSNIDASAESRDIDDQVRTMTGASAPLYTIDAAALAALRPQLIVTQAQCDVCAVRYEDVVSAVRDQPALEGAQVLALNPLSLSDVLQDIQRVGQAAGEPHAADSVVRRLQTRIDAVRSLTADLASSDIPRTACLEWIDPPMLAANWTPQIVELAGGEPGLTVGGRHSTYADWQQIVQYDPQAIVVMPCGFDLPRAIAEARSLPRRDGWPRLSAVRDQRVWAVDGNAYFNRSGPRLVDSLEILAHLLHPQRCPAPRLASGRAWQRLRTHGPELLPCGEA